VQSATPPLLGRPTYLTRDEEALIVASAEMKAAHSAPVNRKLLGAQLAHVLEEVKARGQVRDVKPKSNIAYARDVVRRVNAREDDMIGQKRKTSTGEIKVAGLSNKRAKQSDPRLAWMMFHSQCEMNHSIKKKQDAYFDKIASISKDWIGYREQDPWSQCGSANCCNP